jgi:ABC-type nitrate/sulfonate/bicarbonate transport system permease component
MTATTRRGAWRGLILPVSALLLMEIASHTGTRTSDSFAAPSKIAVAFGEAVMDGMLAKATWETVVSVALGLLIGASFGLVAGISMGLFASLGKAMDLAVEMVRPVPSIALVPVGMLVFGLGYSLEIWIVAFACTWPTLILSRAAIAGVEPCLLEVARTLELTLLERVRKIIIPAILPNIFVAMRLSMTLALIVAITVEITANPIGLGSKMMMAQQSIRPDLMYALLLWIAFLGWTVNYQMLLLERLLFRGLGETEIL